MKPLINIDNGDISYFIGENALQSCEKKLEKHPKLFLLIDENIDKYCMPVFKEKLPDVTVSGIVKIKSGEENKNINTCIDIWEKLTQLGVDRDSVLINIGGGVISDIGGFIAATYKRGIKFINIPTTLIGQIDAAIGGKTGVDFMGFKNQVGLFIDPEMVVIDPVFLNTLEQVYWQSGFAELLKYGLIMDIDLWNMIENKKCSEIDNWNQLIIKAAKDKIDIVRYDTREKGIRKILNFGHTIGHAIETFYLKQNRTITHGQAVAAGMICESWLSSQRIDLECHPQGQICDTIDKNFERLDFGKENIPEIIQLMRQDKKIREGEFKFSLLRRLGKAIHDVKVEDDLVVKSLEFYINKSKCG